jgi:copper chaperone CopZ
MTTALRLRTNLNCSTCVATVTPYLDDEPGVTQWEVDVADPRKMLTVHGEGVSFDRVQAAVAKAGFKVLGEIEDAPAEVARPTTYYPLVLLLAFLLGITGLVEAALGSFAWERAMANFMGGFFLAFSFFKLLDLRGFADSFRMYDIVAQQIPAYAFAYPFVELLLGAAYVTRFQPAVTNSVTLATMSVSAIGVLRSLLSKRKIRCACLGTVFNLPMSTVSFVEDALMALMAAAMLALGSHS